MSPSGFDLSAVCPRLALAHRQRRIELALARERRRGLLQALLRLERLVAHRELQHARSLITGDARYISRREHKLERARGELDALRARAARVGVV